MNNNDLPHAAESRVTSSAMFGAALAGSDILTHHAAHCSPAWMAIHVPTARKVLAGYTDANFDDIAQLMCDYSNVLDRAGLLHYADTEADAVRLALPNTKLTNAPSTTPTNSNPDHDRTH